MTAPVIAVSQRAGLRPESGNMGISMQRPGAIPAFLYLENHSLGEWFQKRLLPEDVQRKTPFARIGVRSGNCTKKQREAIRDE